ncbi:hypothetical protein CGRA01v4_08115 [Colletotrichum graminicola]|nr:hypothetical protein CGRA01v4_08115 [Colletotrichum graminicola]
MCVLSEPFVVWCMMRGRAKRQRRSNLRSSLDTSSARHRPLLASSSRRRRRQTHSAGVDFEFRDLSCHQPKLHVSGVSVPKYYSGCGSRRAKCKCVNIEVSVVGFNCVVALPVIPSFVWTPGSILAH